MGEEYLNQAKWWIQKWGWGFTILMVVVWPVLSLPAGVFSEGYFSMWVFISIAWSFVATFVIVVLPVYESADSILTVCLFILGKEKTSVGPRTPASKEPASKEPAAATFGNENGAAVPTEPAQAKDQATEA